MRGTGPLRSESSCFSFLFFHLWVGRGGVLFLFLLPFLSIPDVYRTMWTTAQTDKSVQSHAGKLTKEESRVSRSRVSSLWL